MGPIVAIKDTGERITFRLVHCKYSGSDAAGARIDDIVEVSSQAVKTCRWFHDIKRLGLYPKDVTPAERIPRVKSERSERRVLTRDEFLALAAAIKPEFRGSIVLQGLCGLRPEEVSPPHRKGMSKKFKRGIFREEFDWEYNSIRLPDPVAKTGYARIVPILPGVREWLEWADVRPDQTGPICDNMVLAGETARLGIEVFKTGWPKDALRHSYGSYRNAIIRSLNQVAEEMGSSVAMLRKHYHNPRAREEGEAWFAMRPSDLEKSSD